MLFLLQSSAALLDGNCHQKLFPASSQLSLLATAKLLESGAGAKPEVEGDASAVLATLAASGENSGSGSGSGQGARRLVAHFSWGQAV